MNRPTTVRAVEDELPETAFESALPVGVQSKTFRTNRHVMGAIEAAGDRLVDQLVSLHRLFGHGLDGSLEDSRSSRAIC